MSINSACNCPSLPLDSVAKVSLIARPLLTLLAQMQCRCEHGVFRSRTCFHSRVTYKVWSNWNTALSGLLSTLTIIFPVGSQLEHRAPFGVSVITHTKTHGRTPRDEWSARHRGLYLHMTTQHTDTRDKHPCSERDSNPRSQQPSGRRPTP
jgi:hypothetical protein